MTEYDKFWMRQFRARLKLNDLKLIGIHVPSGVESTWTVKKDLKKERFNKKEFLTKLLVKVKEKRKAMRGATIVRKVFEGAAYQMVGGVFVKNGEINPLGQFLTTNNPMARKVPRHKNKNYIGIELEFNALAGDDKGQRAIAHNLKAAGLAKYVDVTTDGSCGWEVRVLVLEDEFETILPKIMGVINNMGFPCDERCGTHIHFDMRNRDVAIVYKNLFKTQKFLRKFVTNKRKDNLYCKENTADTFDKQLSLGDRRYSLNVQAYNAHRTLEVRMHHGTLNPDVLIPWISLLLKVANYKEVVDKSVNSLKQATKQFDIEETLVQNLENRILSMRKATPKVAAPDIVQPHVMPFLANWF